ncbi:MAG TPA: hypothetical protein VIT91_03685 [Chthoniobacterales bacterium]
MPTLEQRHLSDKFLILVGFLAGIFGLARNFDDKIETGSPRSPVIGVFAVGIAYLLT